MVLADQVGVVEVVMGAELGVSAGAFDLGDEAIDQMPRAPVLRRRSSVAPVAAFRLKEHEEAGSFFFSHALRAG
jgi:hypothetical protein